MEAYLMKDEDFAFIRGIALACLNERFYERVKGTFETFNSGGIGAKEAREDLEFMLLTHYIDIEIAKAKHHNC
jgi:hypothetical protein